MTTTIRVLLLFLTLFLVNSCFHEVRHPSTSVKRVIVQTADELEPMGLRVPDPEEQHYLDIILETASTGIEENNYIFIFEPVSPAEHKPLILGADGTRLAALLRIAKEDPTCTTWVGIDLRPGESDVAYGGRISSATKGICGAIAAMHSFLQLGLVNSDEVVEGDFFREKPLAKVQGPNKKQMSEKRLRKLHEAVGANTCRQPSGSGFDTNDRLALERFNRDLKEKVKDPSHRWDCTIFLKTRKDGKFILSHFEHVEDVSDLSPGLSIRTTNGLEQGNQKDRVPVAPGSNTWESRPAGTPPFRLTDSTHPDAQKYKDGLPPVGTVNYLCCRQ